MRQHLDDLRTIERMLVDGKLAEAQSLAFFFTRPTGAASRQAPESRDMVLAAGSLATAKTVEDALRHEVRIALACAACHQRENRLPVFRPPANAPRDRPTVAAQMARHQWAVDRLWEGLVGASDEHWRIALDAIATTQLPLKIRPKPTNLGVELQRQARAALTVQTPMTLEQRAAAYGELLVTCAGCHAAQAR